MVRGVLMAAFICAAAAAADGTKSPLEKLETGKVPPGLRPGKGMPKETLAVLGQRGDKCDCFALRDDGRFLAVSGPDQVVRVWDLEGVKQISSPRQADSVVCLAFTPDKKSMIVGDAGGNIRIWDKAAERSPIARPILVAHKDGPVWSLAVSPDGKRLATGGRDRIVRIWDITRTKTALIGSLEGHGDSVRSLAFHADGDRLYSAGGADGQIRIWDLTGDKPKAAGAVKTGGQVTGISCSSDGQSLVSSGESRSSAVWTLKNGEPVDPVPVDTGGKTSTAIAFAPDGKSLVGIVERSDTEDRIRLWSPDGKTTRELPYDSHVHAVGFAPDGRHLIAVTEFNTLLIRIPK